MGFDGNMEMEILQKNWLKKNPDVDLVIMGHSHEADKHETVGNAVLIQPANNGGKLGKVEIKLQDKGDTYEVVDKSRFSSYKGCKRK